MTTALEIGAAFLSAPTLLAAALLLAAFQLGRIVTRDDEQREVSAGCPIRWSATRSSRTRPWRKDWPTCSPPSRGHRADLRRL